jgi:hypothetical protein
MKNSHSMSRLTKNVIADRTPKPSDKFVRVEHTLELVHGKIDGETPRRSRRQSTTKFLMMISLFISWMPLIAPF